MNTLSHVTGWPSEGPTAAQLKEFFAQIESGRITKVNLQEFLCDLKLASVRYNRPILRRLYAEEKIVVGKTDGTRTIAEAKLVFTGYIDPDFTRWGADGQSEPKPEQEAAIFEMVEDTTFARMFGSLGDLDLLCWMPDQIVEFCKKHPDKLRQDGYATFFLYKMSGQYFVASVRVAGRELLAVVFRFVGSGVWGAVRHHRVVVPKLELSGT